MTITLQAGHTYRDRIGRLRGPMLPFPHTLYRWRASDSTQDTWRDDGMYYGNSESTLDLVEEVFPAAEPANPVRQRTVTEVVPGAYGGMHIGSVGNVPDSASPDKPPTLKIYIEMQTSWTAEELRALAATATQLADALDIIAAESQS